MASRQKKKVLAAVSGGVDSAVAAQLLKNQGHEVIGVYMQFWQDDTGSSQISLLESWADAQAVCQAIDIPLYALNFAQEFKRRVVNHFLTTYQAGQTPNPCVVCNKQIKLGRLINYAQKIGFDVVASGHYVRQIATETGYQLWRAHDRHKDQSYFLYQLNQAELAKLWFPLGDLSKEAVRQLADDFQLPVASKPESQEICFVPDSLASFLARHLSLKPGPIIDQIGQVIGQHQGLALYTIGQRRGLEVGGTGPYYVIGQDLDNNSLLVTNQANDQRLYCQQFMIKDLFWVSGQLPTTTITGQVAIRYQHQPVNGSLTPTHEGWLVDLATAQRAVTPGQSAVFYSGDQLLGGGVIDFNNSFC